MRAVVLSAVVLFAGTAAVSAQIVADSLRLAYTGTVTRYASLADAQNGTNAVAAGVLAPENRDLVLSYQEGTGTPALWIGTGWYLTPGGVTYGVGNPNNQNTGFVQLIDNSLASVTASSGAFDAARTTFTLNLSGANALSGTGTLYNTRLWNTTGNEGQGGTFLSYEFQLVASGFAQAVWDDVAGMYIAQGDPTGMSGRFSGIFQNTSAISTYNGYYAFDFSLNGNSWAQSNQAAFSPTTLPENQYKVSTFASAIPEPATYAMLFGAASLVLAGWRRWRRGAI